MTVDKLTVISEAIAQTVEEMGQEGSPGGVIYAAVMGMGVDYHTFMAIMSAHVVSGRLRCEHHCYYPRWRTQ